MFEPGQVSFIGCTNGRRQTQFGIRQADRFFHTYVIGRTGAGKTTLLLNLAKQDILAGRGIVFIDPHGDAAAVLSTVEGAGGKRARYWDVPDPAQPYGYNPLRRVQTHLIPLAASGLLGAMQKLWPDAWGVRMEHMLRNTLYALIEYGEATLPDILRMYTDRAFRTQVTRHLTNPQVRAFWEQEFPKMNPLYRRDAIAPIQNKVGAFLADPRLYRIFTSAPVELSLRRQLDAGEALIINLARGSLGEDSANLLGALVVSTIGVAAMSRASLPETSRVPHVLYVDEFQCFTTSAVANMVSELRKYRVALVLAHQHLHQLEPVVRHAVLANMGTQIAFRIGVEDALVLEREFAPEFSARDLVNLQAHDVILKLMIGGAVSRPFSATTVQLDALAARRGSEGAGCRNE